MLFVDHVMFGYTYILCDAEITLKYVSHPAFTFSVLQRNFKIPSLAF